MPRPFRVGGGMAVGMIAVLLSLFFFVQYLPGMPAGLIWPYEWVIVLLWWVAGVVLMLRLPSVPASPLAEEELIAATGRSGPPPEPR